MVCRKCGSSALRRQKRHGFLQLKVFPLFGLYPWECAMCRKVRMYHRKAQMPTETIPG
jgi:ribosomal protein L40E